MKVNVVYFILLSGVSAETSSSGGHSDNDVQDCEQSNNLFMTRPMAVTDTI